VVEDPNSQCMPQSFNEIPATEACFMAGLKSRGKS
jgi:hypothetical protein